MVLKTGLLLGVVSSHGSLDRPSCYAVPVRTDIHVDARNSSTVLAPIYFFEHRRGHDGQMVTIDVNDSSASVEDGTERFDVLGVRVADGIEASSERPDLYLGGSVGQFDLEARRHFNIESEGRTSIEPD